jgi:hypothetical protein
MAVYFLVRRNPDINRAIGHHTVEVHIENRNGDEVLDQGTMEKYGISTQELDTRFGGDIEKWMEWIGQQMLHKYKQSVNVHTDLLKVHGTAIPIE